VPVPELDCEESARAARGARRLPPDRGCDRQGRNAQHLAVGHLIAPTPRTRLARRKERASYERATVNAILDEAFYCHVGFVVDAQPFVLPTAIADARLPAGVPVPDAVANWSVRRRR
jgi:hypothetical protein